MKILLLMGLLLISPKIFAEPECQYDLNLNNITVGLLPDPQVIPYELSVRRGPNSPAGRCRIYRVFFSKGRANNYQRKAHNAANNSLDYNLHRDINKTGILKGFQDAANANELLEGQAPEKDQSYQTTFYVSAPGLSGHVIPNGMYLDMVEASIYGFNENSGNYLFESTTNLTVLFYVQNVLQISLLDEGASFDPTSTSKVLDFGNLAEHLEKGVDLRVVSNGPYRIKLSSLNNGKLKLSPEDSIAYSLRVNGASVSLGSSSSMPVEVGSGQSTTIAGDKYNLKVKISESTSNKSAGMYQDVITITAIAN